MPNEEQHEITKIKNFYDNVYYKDAHNELTITTHLKKLASKRQLQSGDKVLDVGCGKGEWLLACCQYGVEPFGIDLSERAIEVCKSNMPQGTFLVQSAQTCPFDVKTFDLVTCLGSLEHFIDQLGSLKEMVRVAKDNAEFVILVPNQDFLTRKLGLYSGTYQTDAREIVRTLPEWETIFNQAGLEVIKQEKDLHVLSWEWISMDKWYSIPLRAIQAFMLMIWPLKWQYQVYFFCKKMK